MRTRDRFVAATVLCTGLVAAIATWQTVHSDSDPASQFTLVAEAIPAEPPVTGETDLIADEALIVSEVDESDIPVDQLPSEVVVTEDTILVEDTAETEVSGETVLETEPAPVLE